MLRPRTGLAVDSSGLAVVQNEKAMKAFYERWSASVFTFCRLFLGDEAEAEKATTEAFLWHVRSGQSLSEHLVLAALLGRAVTLVRRGFSPQRVQGGDSNTLNNAILLLPSEEREVFILRCVLQLDAESTYIATGLPEKEIPDKWCLTRF